MRSNHSTWVIYAIWLKFSILKILSRKKKKKSSYVTSIIILWFWFVKHGWSFANNLYIKKEIMNYFVIKIIIDEFIMWSIIVEHDFDGRYCIQIFFFFWFYIFVCCIPSYTIFVYLLEFKKIIGFSYKEDLASRCVYIYILKDRKSVV